jgi:DinB superfamily
MGRSAIEQLTYAMSEAFQGNGEHSLIANLRSLKDEDWRWVPPGGARSIAEIVQHVGECKYVYENHAFGDGSMRWDQPGSIPSINVSDGAAVIIDWLREGHHRLALSTASCTTMASCLRCAPPTGGRVTRRAGF